MFDTNKKTNQLIASGSQHTANPNTIAMAIFNTFLFAGAVVQRGSIAHLESSAI